MVESADGHRVSGGAGQRIAEDLRSLVGCVVGKVLRSDHVEPGSCRDAN